MTTHPEAKKLHIGLNERCNVYRAISMESCLIGNATQDDSEFTRENTRFDRMELDAFLREIPDAAPFISGSVQSLCQIDDDHYPALSDEWGHGFGHALIDIFYYGVEDFDALLEGRTPNPLPTKK